MAQLPLVPLLSHWLLTTAADHSCVSEVLTAVAMLSTDNVFYQPYRDEHKAVRALPQRCVLVIHFV